MKKNIFLLVIFVFSLPLVLDADTIELRSGKTFEGDVISYQNKQIVLRTEAGDLKVKIRMIKNIGIVQDENEKRDWIADIDEDLKELNIRRKDLYEDMRLAQREERTQPIVYKNNIDFQAQDEPRQKKINYSTNRSKKAQYKKVEVYALPGCGYCKRMIAFLKKNGIRFTSYNIETNKSARRKFDSFHASGVPVVVINGNKISRGYNEQAVLQAL